MQIKTRMKYTTQPPEWLKLKRLFMLIKCWRGCGATGTLSHRKRRCELVQSRWKTAWHFPLKLNMHVHYDLAVSLLTKSEYIFTIKTYGCIIQNIQKQRGNVNAQRQWNESTVAYSCNGILNSNE